MNKVDKNRKLIFFISIIVLVVITIVSSTIAYFGWIAEEESTIDVTVISGTGKCEFKSDNNVEIEPVATRDSGRIVKFTAKQELAGEAPIAWNMIINEIVGLQDTTFKYEMINTTTGAYYGSGNFENITSEHGSNRITFSNETEKLTYNTEYEFTLYLWIDGTIGNNPLSMAGQSLDFDMNCVIDGTNGSGGSISNITLIDHVYNLYKDASKTEVPAADGITYNYAKDVSLMNDRLGNANTGINDGNIRYYGATPDNYVNIGDVYEQDTIVGNWEEYGFAFENSSKCYAYFEDDNLINLGVCTDAESCATFIQYLGASSVSDVCDVSTVPKGTPILYRIIGLFKDVELTNGTKRDLIKVIRNEPIGLYSWDQSSANVNNGFGINEWSQADLMKLLNPGYEEETVGGSLYWNSEAGSCYSYDNTTQTYTSVPCDFTNRGLSKNAQNNIETVKWNLGGWNSNSTYASNMYEYERGNNVIQNASDGLERTNVWPCNIALAYPSDYGYAVDFGSCSSMFINYNGSACTSTNWMYHIMTFKGKKFSWLLTPNSGFADRAWLLYSVGSLQHSIFVNLNYGVSPVFYLDSELTVKSGTGKSNDPYVLW